MFCAEKMKEKYRGKGKLNAKLSPKSLGEE